MKLRILSEARAVLALSSSRKASACLNPIPRYFCLFTLSISLIPCASTSPVYVLMPTPVTTARPCLADDAAAALDAAVSAARRRSHAQTTSLHVVFALLSSSSPAPPLLRDAVARARSSAYAPRLQFKALELCFGVALDRLPSSHRPPPPTPSPPSPHPAATAAGEPPVSNSLMAAIKRSQAHQRRNPDTFHLYQHYNQMTSSQSASTSSFSGVKVELQQLILAILDDPVVSRVFADAGFRSCDIKLAVLRPPPLRFSRRAPMFLDLASSPRGFPFPLHSQINPDPVEENCRRVAEVLTRSHNPVLVGLGAADAARDFAAAAEQQNWSVLPAELHGVKMVHLDLSSRVEDVGRTEGVGVVVSVGDLKRLVEEDAGISLVPELTKALEINRGRMWVMGWSATYEGYMKLLSKYPLLDKAWNLQLLPITSLRSTMGGTLPRTQSMMESFVPFGGFFPAAYEQKILLSKPHQSPVRCQDCNDSYEKEVADIQSGCSPSVGNRHETSMPAWLRKADTAAKGDEFNSTKAKDDRSILSAKVMDLQRKWNDNCQRLHRDCQILDTDKFEMVSHNPISKNSDATQNRSGGGNVLSMTTDLNITKTSQSISLPLTSGNEDTDLISKLQLRLSKSEQLQTEGFRFQRGTLSELCVHGGSDSPSSITSVTTDLVLGTPCKEVKPAPIGNVERLKDLSECLPPKEVNEFITSAPEVVRHPYPCLPMHTHLGSKVTTTCGVSAYGPRCPTSLNKKPFDPTNFKMFYTSLIEKVGRQEEALCAISEAVARCRAGHGKRHGARIKGDIWLNFLGHDRIGKKKAAMALAELMFGSKENFVCIDLGFQEGFSNPNTICDQEGVDEYDVRFRGKTIVDHIAEEVSKNPWSVIFLENVNKADFLVQTSLSQAIQTGKLSNSYGREFSINNAIFVTTVKTICEKISSPRKECINFSEESILGAQRWKMKLVLESVSVASGDAPSFDISITSSPLVNKRKPGSESLGASKRVHRSLNTFLDLNLPVEEEAASDVDCSSGDESNSISGSSEAWLEELFNLMDGTVRFRQFDFDALADHVLKEISKTLRSTTGCKFTLEIDVKVMEQILAATWLLENPEELNNWLEKVFVTSVAELRQRYNISTRIALKLVAWEGAPMDRTPGILLPSRIIVE